MKIQFFFAMTLLAFSAQRLCAADSAWPNLPKASLSFKKLPNKTEKTLKSDSIEVDRGENRIAQIMRIDYDGDGKFEAYTFNAFVGRERVLVMVKLRNGKETSQFNSCDD